MASKRLNMFTSKSFVKKEKHHNKRKTRSKKEPLEFESYFKPHTVPKIETKIQQNINNFWRFSPKNKFSSQKPSNAHPKKGLHISSIAAANKAKTPYGGGSLVSAGNMSSLLSRRESENTAAVMEARLEIEKIKTELETLINSNIKSQAFYSENVNPTPHEDEKLLETVQETYDPRETYENYLYTQDVNKSESVFKKSPKPSIRTSSLRPATSPSYKKNVLLLPEDTIIEKPKPRPYDPEKTREFIKKQKQRRKEKLLEEEQKKQEKENTRKHKLEELKKKTLQLVAKNLQKSTNKSAKTTCDVNTNASKSNPQAQLDNKSVNKYALQSRRCRARSFDHGSRDKDSDANKRSRSVSREITKQPSKQSVSVKPTTNISAENPSLIDTKSQVTLKSSSQKSLTPTPKTNIATKTSPPKSNETSMHNQSKEMIKTELPVSVTPNLNLEIQKQEKKSEQNSETSNAAKELSEIKQKLETSITQIKDKNELQLWLQHPSSVPYPYNFISAVRKKLEIVTRKQPLSPTNKNDENHKLNISTQCTIDKKILDVNSVNIPKLESPKHNNRTYESHKCRRQLYIPDKIKTNEIEISINKSDSDSDTAKNIPEIPHEETAQAFHKSIKTEENKNNITFDKSSATSISRNITFERNIPSKLNIGDIKLPEPAKYAGLIPPDDKIEIPKISRKNRSKYPEDIDSILSHYSKIKSEQNSYSDDFNSASSKPETITEYKQIPTSLSKTGSISEHVPQNYSNSSSKENISESHETNKSNKPQTKLSNSSILSENRTVSTETNLTMKDVSSLSSKQSQSDIVTESVQTVSNSNKSETVKKLTKPEIFLKRRAEEIENNPNHIHLKLQAEVHLLNSFNNSLKQVVAVEKSLFDVPSTSTKNFNPINCKRGCDFPEVKPSTENVAFTNGRLENGGQHNLTNTKNISDIDYESICSQDFRISNVDRSSLSTTIASKTTTIASNSIISRRDDVDLKSHPYVAISLDMVDQMIKDEDIRLEHLKAVLKLRDQALFDRIKGELALLEIRKRELREHGSTNDITAIKKKQRGLIIKLQQERHEMHRLKTAHKQAAKARKTALHEQKSIIKTQLSSTDQIPKKLRRLSHLERPSLGPIKVYRVDSSKTEVSETTLSRKGSDDSVTNSSVLTQISEKISVEKSEIYYSDSLAVEPVKSSNLQSEKLKRSLLMKEAEIDKRRKEIEDLIKWQKRLKQKEAEVVELERKAVKSLQSDDQQKVRVFSGAHLNKVWKGIALPDKNFDEQKKYQMSKRSLDKFYQNARKMFKEVSEEEKQLKTESYSSEFEQTNSTSRLEASLNEVQVEVEVEAADRLLHISDIISVPESESSIKEHEKSASSEDVSSIQEDNKSVSVSLSESPSVKTEVNTLIKSDSKIESIQSEFTDSLQNKSPIKTKSLELIIASEYSSLKPDELIKSESLKTLITDSLEASQELQINTENFSPPQEAAKTSVEFPQRPFSTEDTSIESEISSARLETSDKFQSELVAENIKDSLNSSLTSISEVSDKSTPQVFENINSLNSSIKSVSEVSSKSVPQILETIISEEADLQVLESEKSSPKQATKSDTENLDNIISEISTSKTASKESEPQIFEDIVSEKSLIETKEISESPIVDIVDEESFGNTVSEASKATQKSTSPILDIIAEVSSAKSSSEATEPQVFEEITSVEATEKSESQITENIVSEKGLPKSISETCVVLENISADESPTKTEISTTTEVPEKSVPDFVDSLKSKSEVSTLIAEVEQSEHQTLENDGSPRSSVKPISETSDKPEPQALEEATSISEVEESIESPATQGPENIITSEESYKGESWEPQIISEVKSDSSDQKIKSETEINELKTNSETHISEQNLQTDTTTPCSEFQYETDFDKLSESDQSKIETESNVSLKETNVDSSINEDESTSEKVKSKDEEEETSEAHSNTIKLSPKDPEKSDSESHEDEDTDSKKGVSHIDVRKRVSEILADANANGPRGDKSPRVQDLYTTTYDIAGSSESTPDSGSPTNEFNKQEKTSFSPETPYINEAEELLRKQLEIEQEIKRLERQQQNIPYLFMREIPNKPPPPYKPPDFPLTPVIASIIPSKPEQTKKIINDATATLFNAYTTGDLANTSSNSNDDQQRFMFDLCKEIALEACKPTIEAKIPSWKTQKNKFHNLFAKRPITKDTLNSVLSKKVLQLLNFEPVTRNDSLIIRWSRKKRDHVDEILVSETQAEEAEWTNFDSDEEVIKENLTQTILEMLIVDASKDVNDILKKKKCFRWVDC